MICISTIHSYISGGVDTFVGKLIHNIWLIFSMVNGNPEITNYGIRLFLGLFFSLFLLMIIQLRTREFFDKKHFVVLIGVVFLVFRWTLMIGFEWGWQINLYNDWILHFLSPPLEHFFHMMFFGCLAYFSLNVYNYYPGILKRILWLIPIIIFGFFIYFTIEWKIYFIDHLPALSKYKECVSDWQNHGINAVIAGYVFFVSIWKGSKNQGFLSTFWGITFLEHITRTIVFYNNYEPAELATIFHAMATWAIPFLILYFVNAYVASLFTVRDRRNPSFQYRYAHDIVCSDCGRIEKLNGNNCN